PAAHRRRRRGRAPAGGAAGQPGPGRPQPARPGPAGLHGRGQGRAPAGGAGSRPGRQPGRSPRPPPAGRATAGGRPRTGGAGAADRVAAARPRPCGRTAAPGPDRRLPGGRGRGPGRPLPAQDGLAAVLRAGPGMKASRLRLLLNLWPPYLFSGVRVTGLTPDFRRARVELRQRWYNRNYVGTHFGGSLFAMTDPFWMLLAMRRLGPDYLVWDRQGTISFEKPGRGTVVAE